jgi:dihydropteroate synthase type 2
VGPRLVGIVNVTADSFSDGGRTLEPGAAIERARELIAAGADRVELGAASSHPDAAPVPAAEEIRRLAPVLDELLGAGVPLAVDSWQPEVQRYCLRRGVQMLNDIQGFPHPELYRELREADALLVVMHSLQERGRATRVSLDPEGAVERVYRFFETRLAELVSAGIPRERLVLDPGMGFFLGSTPEPSLALLRELPRLRRRFALPVLVSVSRKSFLGSLTGRDVGQRGAATLAAELFAAARGVDYIRTHDVAALRDGLAVQAALEAPAAGSCSMRTESEA